MAIVDVRNVSVEETDISTRMANFEFFLDEVATAPVVIQYYTQDGTAAAAESDYTAAASSVTIDAGESSAIVNIRVRGDRRDEGNETFKLIAIARSNAELAGGAAALVATGTIVDNDDSSTSGTAGQGDLAERIMGPTALAGLFPTLDVRGTSSIEGDSSGSSTRFLITLDRPATAEVSGQYFLQAKDASNVQGDYSDGASSFIIPAGSQSTYVSARISGDTAIEGNEEYQLVLINPVNAVLADNAAALIAAGTIIDDDDADGTDAADIGDFSEKLDGPYPEPGDAPTLRIHDTKIIEGDNSVATVRFLVTLDKPAPADVTFLYAFNGSDASGALNDFSDTASRFTIEVGEQAGTVTSFISGDNIIEGDETFTVTLADLKNAVFEDGAPIVEATGTILDDDGGDVSDISGIGDPGRGVEGPATGPTFRLEAVNTSVIEGDSRGTIAYVHVILSAPAVGIVSVDYETVAQSATAGDDYSAITTRNYTFAEGQQSGFIPVGIAGDNDIEGNESFGLRFSNPQGVVFDRGGETMDATILIRDNDTGTIVDPTDTGPDFNYLTFTPGATPGDDTIRGDDEGNQIAARAGDDVVYGGGSGDLIDGGPGEDSLFGEDGSDWITPGDGGGVVHGGAGRDMVSFVTLSDTPGRLNTQYRLTVDLETGIATTTGTDVYQLTSVERLTGTIYADYIRGDAGDNELRGLGDYDWFVVTEGSDTYDGGTGQDMVSFLDWFSDDISVADVFDTGAPFTGANVSGVVVDLADSSNNTNLAASHTFTSIERITGSGREDVFYGDDGENDFRGLGGYDWFVSSEGGRERYYGGDGIDTVTYFNATSGIEASLSNGALVNGEQTGTGTQGVAARDLYFEIEALVGSNFNDVLRGSSDKDFLSGLAGDDFIYGFGGADRLKGGDGNDRIIGGGGTDTAYFDGNFADFTFSRVDDETINVVGQGIDRLIEIELMQFDDQEVSVLSIL